MFHVYHFINSVKVTLDQCMDWASSLYHICRIAGLELPVRIINLMAQMTKSSHRMLTVSNGSEWCQALAIYVQMISEAPAEKTAESSYPAALWLNWTAYCASPSFTDCLSKKREFSSHLQSSFFQCRERQNLNSLCIFCIGEVRRPQISCRSKYQDMDLELKICKTASWNPRCNIEQAHNPPKWQLSSIYCSLQILDFAENFVADNTSYIRWRLMC